MAKTCPPGVLCIENYTFVFLIIVVTIAIGWFLSKSKTLKGESEEHTGQSFFNMLPSGFNVIPGFGGDTLTDPYLPPLKDNRYFPLPQHGQYGLPINMRTRGFDTSYRQVGILTRVGAGGDPRETILPIMGRPLFANRDKWQFYTMSDSNNSVKLPISLGGKHCTGEYGCDDISNADTVYVEGYNTPFKATIYENEFPRYIPFV
uniref:Uncharacterized protein n=1 Tax=viral metagenome TaxID=1070528 RepID=A0A6C0BV86_9ZZZZ